MEDCIVDQIHIVQETPVTDKNTSQMLKIINTEKIQQFTKSSNDKIIYYITIEEKRVSCSNAYITKKVESLHVVMLIYMTDDNTLSFSL